MAIEIPFERLPALYAGFAKQVPFAMAQALNDVAFDARHELQTEILPENLDLKNKWTQRSIQVEKAKKNNLVARVGSVSWYVERLVTGGTTRAKRGVMHNGKRYLFVPAKRTKSGKLSKVSGGPSFVIEAKNGTLLLVKRRGKKLITLGFLVDDTTHDKEIPWERDVETVIRRQWKKRFAQRMAKAIATAK